MAEQTTIQGSDIIKNSRAVLNANFAALNAAKVEGAAALTTAGAIPYVSAAGVVASDPTKLSIDPATGVVSVPAGIAGNAATATRLATPRTIAGVSFDGSANIAIASTGLSDSSALVRGAAAVAAGGVPYATAAGVLGTDAGFTYNPAKRDLALAYPIDVFDNFSGPAGAALNGRMPIVGSFAWQSSGDGFASAYAGNGVMGVSVNQNTYFIVRGSSTPFEVTTTIRSTSGAPGTTISILKNNTTFGFGVMWHVVYSGTGINHLYWNLIANGGAADVTSAAPVSQVNSTTAPTLLANTDYVCRLTINGAYSDASIETTDGVVLFRSRAYDPLIPSLVGPWVYVQSGTTALTFSSFRMTTRPPKPSFDYGRFVSGIDGTPIGSLAPSPGHFSVLTVGGPRQAGVFTVNYNGQANAQPRFVGNGGAGVLRIESDAPGFASRLEIANGFAGVGTIQMGGDFGLTLAGNSGSPFLTKPANAADPFFAGSLGFAGNTSANPKLKPSGTELQVRLGDDSAFSRVAVSAIRLTGLAEPAANAGNEGLLVYTLGSTGVSGSLRICARLTDGSYAWVPLF